MPVKRFVKIYWGLLGFFPREFARMASYMPSALRLTLAVDTSLSIGSIALFRGHSLLAVHGLGGSQPHSSGLFLHVSALCDESGVDLPMIDLYAVTSGPGSFTGLRIGL